MAQLVLLREPQHGNKSRGGPVTTFTDTLEQDSCINRRDLPAIMERRDKWRAIIRNVRVCLICNNETVSWFYFSPLSYKFDDQQLTKWFDLNKEIQVVLGGGLPRDFIHSLKYLPRLPKEKAFRKLTEESLRFTYDQFDGHRESFDPGTISFPFMCFHSNMSYTGNYM